MDYKQERTLTRSLFGRSDNVVPGIAIEIAFVKRQRIE